MKNKLRYLLPVLTLVLSSSITKAQTGYYGPYAQVMAADSNSGDNYFSIYDTITNNNDSILILITPNYSLGGVIDTFPFGVWYYNNQWNIINEIQNGIPIGSRYNVVVPNAHGTAISYVANIADTSYAASFINNPACNGNPNALVFAVHNFNPSDSVNYQIYDTVPLGVYYDTSVHEWALFNENEDFNFTPNTAYNVFVPDSTSDVFTVTANGFNTAGNILYIDNPATNNDSTAVLIVTQNWNPGGIMPGVLNDNMVGVWYMADSSKWVIFNENGHDIPSGASFNVMVANGAVSGIDRINTYNEAIKIYPNPANQYINIILPNSFSTATHMEVYNVLGQCVLTIPQLTGKETRISTSQWAAGCYFMHLYDGVNEQTNEFEVGR